MVQKSVAGSTIFIYTVQKQIISILNFQFTSYHKLLAIFILYKYYHHMTGMFNVFKAVLPRFVFTTDGDRGGWAWDPDPKRRYGFLAVPRCTLKKSLS